MKPILSFLVAAMLVAPVALATEIVVSYSEDFAEMLEDEYGEREGEYLARTLRKDIEQALASRGVDASRIEVIINEAKPNKPTFEQLGDTPSLDYYRSISLGGMDVSARAFDAAGELIAATDYEWFEYDIRRTFNAGTWWDAQRASDRFSRRLAKDIEEAG